MDSSKIKVILVIIFAAFAALYLGITAATAQFETIAWIVGGTGLATCLLLGRRIFLLLPLMSSLSLVLPLPGNFSTGLIAQGVVLAFATALFLMRRLPMRTSFTELEAWCLLLSFAAIQAYLRNPVGLSIFGSDSVGAKPYFVFGLTAMTALLLSLLLIDPKDIKTWARLSFLGSLLNFTVGAIGYIFPQAGYYLGASFATDVNREVTTGVAGRVSFVRNLSVALALWVSSRISPLRACFHPVYLPLILFSLALGAFSGFRSQIILIGLIFLIGICYRGGLKSTLASLVLGACGLLMLSYINLVVPLPLTIQRAVSFLPGSWDESVKRDGEGSTDWRVEMWKEALLTDRWIANKWLGDGLGFTKQELERMRNFEEGKMQNAQGVAGMTVQQESMMVTGGYHSGPVQTIRTIGYVGLAILLVGFIRMGFHAHRQIQRTRNTEWFTATLFICIPFIANPLSWVFVYGSFEGGAGLLLIGCAVIRMLEKNLPLPAYSPRQRYALPVRAPQAERLTANKA